MKIVILLTADYAYIDPGSGKLNILGVFDLIRAKSFPVIHRRFYLAIRVVGDHNAKRTDHLIAVRLADIDGKDLVALEGPFQLQATEPGVDSHHDFALEFNDMVFPATGDYRFYVSINNDQAQDSLLMRVVAEVAE